MRLIINENQLRLLVKEELGVLQGVYDEAVRVFKTIVSDLPNREKEDGGGSYTIQRGSVGSEIDGYQFKISYQYRNFLNKEEVDKYGESCLVTGGSAYLGRYHIICNINLYGINGTIVKEKAVEVIQHELEHILQQFRSQKTIPNNMLYAKMRNDMESSDEKRHKVGRLIYGCLKSEQDGFINGLYSYCMVDNFATPPYDYSNISNSEVGKLYIELIEIFDDVKNDIELKKILKEYKWSLKKVEKCINELIHKIGRVLVKVNNDKSKFGWRI